MIIVGSCKTVADARTHSRNCSCADCVHRFDVLSEMVNVELLKVSIGEFDGVIVVVFKVVVQIIDRWSIIVCSPNENIFSCFPLWNYILYELFNLEIEYELYWGRVWRYEYNRWSKNYDIHKIKMISLNLIFII